MNTRRMWCQHFLLMRKIKEFLGPCECLLKNVIRNAMVYDVDKTYTASSVGQLFGNSLLFLGRTRGPGAEVHDRDSTHLGDYCYAYVRSSQGFTELRSLDEVSC